MYACRKVVVAGQKVRLIVNFQIDHTRVREGFPHEADVIVDHELPRCVRLSGVPMVGGFSDCLVPSTAQPDLLDCVFQVVWA